MSRRKARAAALFVAGVLGAAGCQSQTDPALGTADATALCTALAAYFEAANAGDADRWASLYTEDAVMTE
jgi:hypothetical protein